MTMISKRKKRSGRRNVLTALNAALPIRVEVMIVAFSVMTFNDDVALATIKSEPIASLASLKEHLDLS